MLKSKLKEKAEISVIDNLNKRFNEIETLVATVEKQSSKSEKLMEKCELSLARINQELKKNTHELQDKISKLSDQTDATIFKIKNLVNEM